MTDLILCHSALASNPYFFPAFGINIYSIEELCYLLYNNAYLLDEDVMDEEMCDFLIEEAEMPKLGTKLKEMLANRCTLGEYVMTILEDSFYLDKEELKEVKRILLDSYGLDKEKKHKLRGDNMLRNGKYTLALDEYRYIAGIMDKELNKDTYALVLHNMGTAYAGLFLIKEAAECFFDAYELSGERESAVEFLLASRFINDNEKYERIVLRYGFNEDINKEAKNRYEEFSKLTVDSVWGKELKKINDLRESGKSHESDEALNDLIGRWKKDYREGMMNQHETI